MNTVIPIIVSALAVWEIVEIWHHSELFAARRAYLEACDGRLARMLLCPFCLSVWVSLLVIFIMKLSDYFPQHEPRWMIDCIQLPIYGFAVARLANILNDLTRKQCRTPKQDLGDDSELKGQETEFDAD